MGRPKRNDADAFFDSDLADLPVAARWREWMLRIEAAIFAATSPVPRETLARIVGDDARLDDLIADLQAELRARPYELAFVAGGYQLRTRPRFASAIRLAHGDRIEDAGPPALTRTEMLALAGIAYLQPATRAALSRHAGREISRDVLGALKRHGLIAAALRAPEPGAPLAWVTTGRFLEAFGLASLRELPDLERLQDEGFDPSNESRLDRLWPMVDADNEGEDGGSFEE
ncbi:SMC-Scp complex subunit ScpB [Methylocystis parvus]|uniref:SMC-Scp complex subunit ScpB n=1 Tax=Methylocystis parvus TaxID=134 RepID=A0A6B8MBT4_9HYPH|nr:SMC-Scp complex subunit ScpB [Methylocystis parvus]QGM99855.1 SMC-Scp complex subunit ScpB [Methylocystis parvus]WBK02279.1 SMC-Scp complex subunit ScpB [Methylocystis parvus OBBP]